MSGMAKIEYSIQPEPERTARAMGYEMDISFKHAVEICRALKGKKVPEAKEYLEDVMAMKRAVPFKKYKRDVGHRRGLNGWYAGRYPKKAARAILKVIQNAEGNAEYKGLDPEEMVITHIQAKKGRVIQGIMPRAYGRATPKNNTLTTVELVIEEVR